jgi:hypothetical protein
MAGGGEGRPVHNGSPAAPRAIVQRTNHATEKLPFPENQATAHSLH